jgi:hypothetical protein
LYSSYFHTGLIARTAGAAKVASDSALKRERERKKRGRYKSADLRNAETYLDKIGTDSRTVVRRSSIGSVLPLKTGTGMGSGCLGVNYDSSFPLLAESNPYRGGKYRDTREVWPTDKWYSKECESKLRERAVRGELAEIGERDYEIDRVGFMTKSMETEMDSLSSCRTTGRRKSIGSSGGRITGGVFEIIDLDASISGFSSFKKGVSAVAESDKYKLAKILLKPGRGHSNCASL